MKIKQHTIESILREWQKTHTEMDGFAAFMAAQLGKMQNTRQELKQLQDKLSEINKIYTAQRLEIEAAVKKLQQECTHKSTTYHPDASGNNDSSTSCNVCGAEALRRGGWEATGRIPYYDDYDNYDD